VTITGKRPQSAVDPDAEGYDTPSPANLPDTLATGVRATITLPAGTRGNPDTDEVISYAFRCDPIDVDVTRFDTVTDESTGITYNVASVQRSHPLAFGLSHITGRIYLTKGLQTGGASVVPA
jgi:hypothetical protein